MMNDLFPRVGYVSDLEPWSSPTFIPPSPHNLPAETAATTADTQPSQVSVSEPYRYASIIDLTFQTTTASQKLLDAPIGRRNLLGFRNVSGTTGENIFIGFGRDATINSWLRLTPGTIILFDTVVPQDDLYCISEAGTPILSYIYSTFPG
jgi:hypothetical protein